MILKDKIAKIITRCGSIATSFVLCMQMVGGLTVQGYAGCTVDKGCVCGGCEREPITWGQNTNENGAEPWADFKMNGGSTIRAVGCFAVSVAIHMGLSGDFGDKFCPQQLFTWGYSNGLWSGNSLQPFVIENYPDHEGIFKCVTISDEALKEVAGEGFGGQGNKGITGSKTDLYDLAVKLAQKGYYVVLEVSYTVGGQQDHFIPVIDVEKSRNACGYELVTADMASTYDNKEGACFMRDKDDTPSDSSNTMATIRNGSNAKYYSGHLRTLRVYTSATKFTGRDGNVPSGGTLEDKQKAANINYIGLAEFLSEDYYLDIKRLEEDNIRLPIRNDFDNLDQIAEIENWADSLEYQKEDKVHGFLRGGVMFVGILIIVYATLLFLAYQFDRINNFIDINVLGIITGHRLSVLGDEQEQSTTSSSGTRYIKQKDIFIITLTGIAIGVLILTGKLYEIVSMIVQYASEHIG